MHSGHSCGAKSTVARDTGLITPGKKNIYNANYTWSAAVVTINVRCLSSLVLINRRLNFYTQKQQATIALKAANE